LHSGCGHAQLYQWLLYERIPGRGFQAHDRNPSAKADFINRFDTALGKLNLDEVVLGICADHSTDCYRGEHNGDSVPVLIHNPLGRKDLVSRFNETDCITGALGRLTAQSFLISVLDAMGSLSNYKPLEMEFYQFTKTG